jgi:hypothetical protein
MHAWKPSNLIFFGNEWVILMTVAYHLLLIQLMIIQSNGEHGLAAPRVRLLYIPHIYVDVNRYRGNLNIFNFKENQMGECSGDNNAEKWIEHYSSSHKILLVGEGDFSFSACLAKEFGTAANMIATSFDSKGISWVQYLLFLYIHLFELFLSSLIFNA